MPDFWDAIDSARGAVAASPSTEPAAAAPAQRDFWSEMDRARKPDPFMDFADRTTDPSGRVPIMDLSRFVRQPAPPSMGPPAPPVDEVVGVPTDTTYPEMLARQRKAAAEVEMAQQAGPFQRGIAVAGTSLAGGVDSLQQSWQDLSNQSATMPPAATPRQSFREQISPTPAPVPLGTRMLTAAAGGEQNARDIRTLAEHAGPVEQFIGGLAAIPPSLLEPKAIAAMLISGPMAGALLRGDTYALTLAGLSKKFGPKLAGAVDAELRASLNLGAFSAAHAGIEGKSPEEIAGAGLEGAVQGLAFGAPGAFESLRGRSPVAGISTTDVPAPSRQAPGIPLVPEWGDRPAPSPIRAGNQAVGAGALGDVPGPVPAKPVPAEAQTPALENGPQNARGELPRTAEDGIGVGEGQAHPSTLPDPATLSNADLAAALESLGLKAAKSRATNIGRLREAQAKEAADVTGAAVESGAGQAGGAGAGQAEAAATGEPTGVPAPERAVAASVPAEPAPKGAADGAQPELSIEPARYAKDKVAVRAPSASDFKSRGAALAEAIGGRWSNREKAYIMSKSQAAKLERLHREGWDANVVSKTLIKPGELGNTANIERQAEAAQPAPARPKETSNAGQQEEAQRQGQGLLSSTEPKTGPAPAQHDTPTSTPERASLTQRLDAIEQAALDRLRSNAVPRGRSSGATTLPQDVVDVAIVAAARTAKAGIRTVAAVRKAVSDVAAEMGVVLGKHGVTAETLSRRIVANSAGKDGKVDDARFEAQVADAHKRTNVERPGVKAQVREATGQAPAPKTVTEPQALAASMKAQERAGAAGFKAGKEAGKAEALAPEPETTKQTIAKSTGLADTSPKVSEADALASGMKKAEKASEAGYRAGKRDAVEQMTAKLEGIREQVRSKAATVEQVRKAVVSTIEQFVPNRRQHAFIEAASSAKTIADYWRVLARAQHEAIRAVAKNAKDAAEGVLSEAGTKLLQEYRDTIQAQRGEMENLRRELQHAETASAINRIARRLWEVHDKTAEAIAQNKIAVEFIVRGKAVQREQVVKSVEESTAKLRGIKPSGRLETDPKAGFINRADRNLMSPDTMGSVAGSPEFKQMIGPDLWDAETRVKGRTQKSHDAMLDALRKAGFEPGSDRAQRLSADVVGDRAVDVTEIKLPSGETLRLTPAEHMALWATLDDANAGPQILDGSAGITFRRGKLTKPIMLDEAGAKAIEDALPAELRAMVSELKAHVEAEVRPGVFAAFREMKGYDLNPVERYWRTRRNLEQRDVAPESVQKFLNRALENLGFEKPREGGKLPYLISDIFTDFHDITHQGAVVAEMSRPVRQLEFIGSDLRFKRAMARIFGADAAKHLNRLELDAKMLFREPVTAMDKAVAFVTKGLARSQLPVNPSPMLKNVGGTFKLFAEMDAADIAAGAKGMYSPEVNRIMEKDPFFRGRYEESANRRVNSTLGERSPLVGESSVKDSARRALSVTKPVQAASAVGDLIDRIPLFDMADAIPVRIAVAGKLREAARLGKSAEWAAREAEYVVRRTQNTSSPLDSSEFSARHRGKAVAAAAAMFKSDQFKSWNMLRRGWAEDGGRAGPRFRKALAAVALNTSWASAVGTALSVGAIKLLAGGQQDEKKPGIAEGFGRRFARDLAGMIPGGDWAADLLLAGADAAAGRQVDVSRIIEGPVADTFRLLAEGVVAGAQWASAGDDVMKSGPHRGETKASVRGQQSVEKLATFVGRLLGIPAEPLVRLGMKVRDAAE